MFSKIKRILREKRFKRSLKQKARLKSCSILITWNRGLGDIPLGIYPLVSLIKRDIPHAEITLLVRENLKDAASLLPDIKVWAHPGWQRGKKASLESVLAYVEKKQHFDWILHNPDVTQLIKETIGVVIPRLSWDQAYDNLCERITLNSSCKYIGVHVHSETSYGYEKNWSPEQWQELFHKMEKKSSYKFILFGVKKNSCFVGKNIIDLRGDISLLELLSLIKNKCCFLIAPDSGILNLVYYLDASFPIKVISLWADPMQGLLKHNVFSPNMELKQLVLIGEHKQINRIPVDAVEKYFTDEDLWAQRLVVQHF